MQLPKLLRPLAYSIALLIAASTNAHADLVIPVIFQYPDAIVEALLAVIFLESYVIANRRKRKITTLFGPIGIANLISTVVGIPFSAVSVGMVSFPLNYINEHYSSLYNKISDLFPAVDPGISGLLITLALMIVCFFASCYIEQLIARNWFQEVDEKQFKRDIFIANLYSYIALAIVVIGMSIWSIRPLTQQ